MKQGNDSLVIFCKGRYLEVIGEFEYRTALRLCESFSRCKLHRKQ